MKRWLLLMMTTGLCVACASDADHPAAGAEPLGVVQQASHAYYSPKICTSSAQCHDGNPCTVDTCEQPCDLCFSVCKHSTAPMHGAACAVQCVKPDTGTCNDGVCIGEPTVTGGACDDGNLCTENDSCLAGVCKPGTPKQCDAGEICVGGRCQKLTVE